MKRTILLLSILFVYSACKNSNKTTSKIENETEEIGFDATPEISEERTIPSKPEETEFYEPIPPTVDPKGQGGFPSDAIILFNGDNMDAWEHPDDSRPAEWIINEDGSMTVNNKSGNIQTKQNFGDVQLHIEWKSPEDIQGDGQHRGNSGIFLQSRYEVQVLDNNDNDTYVNGQVGSIYKQSVPLAKASVSTGEWNTYDIIFHAPKFDEDGELVKKGTITVLHNGILIQDHFEIQGATKYIGLPEYEVHGKAPLLLQDHKDNSRVSYRNIWLREL